MELISMVDFVLMQDGNLSQNDEDRWFKSHQYAEFLKQPLELWMFVPCDDDGNVWKYPPTKDEWEWAKRDSTEAEQSFEQKEYNYNKAKDKVLFEFDGGIKLVRNKENFFIIEYKNGFYLRVLKNNTKTTVESLFKFSVGVKLTETAIKQII